LAGEEVECRRDPLAGKRRPEQLPDRASVERRHRRRALSVRVGLVSVVVEPLMKLDVLLGVTAGEWTVPISAADSSAARGRGLDPY
jgi:hypothetical protein